MAIERQVLVNDTLEEDLGEPVVEGDINPEDWLGRDDTNRVGKVLIKGLGTMKVAALTQDEFETLQKGARRPQKDGKIRVDGSLLARLVISKAIGKANPGVVVTPERLGGKLTGDLIAIQKQVLALSGLDDEISAPDPTEVFV